MDGNKIRYPRSTAEINGHLSKLTVQRLTASFKSNSLQV